MSHFAPLARTSVLALLVSAPGAFADVRAQDVWNQWKSNLASTGQTMSVGSETMVGNTLTVTDVQLAFDMPEVGFNSTISSIAFRENGDGTVAVILPQEYPLTIAMRPEGDDVGTINLLIRQTDMTVIASGTPQAISYAMAGAEIAVLLDSLDVEGGDDVNVEFVTRIGNISGNYGLANGNPRPFTSSFNAGSLTVELAVDAPSENGKLDFTLAAAGLRSSSSGALPLEVDYQDMSAAIAAGFATMGTFGLGAGTMEMEFQDRWDTAGFTGSFASFGGEFAFSQRGMSYGTNSTGVALEMSGSGLPLPSISLSLAESAFGLSMPVVRSETPQDVGLLFRVIDLAVNEDLWGMIDPGMVFPRDPITFVLDLDGRANWLVDIMAPDAERQMAMAGGMPGQIHALDIIELRLAALGASLLGEGGFTFNNNDLMTWGGMPAPAGTVDLRLVGINALIDRMVTAGFLPQDQAMMGRMMLGMFARPGDGPDTLVSRIEVRENGSVFANGQQLK